MASKDNGRARPAPKAERSAPTKFLFTLLYLVLTVAEMGLGLWLMLVQQKQLQGGKSALIRTSLLSATVLLVSFCEFWALTRIFPFKLILMLIGALVLGVLLVYVTGAITGFSLPEKQQKIYALSVIWFASQQARTKPFLRLLQWTFLASKLGALWVFWTHPVGDAKAVVLIALFQFVLLQAGTIPAGILMQWPIVTSEYLDDDIRNSYLAQQFSVIVYSTIYLLFPLWLFKQDIRVAFPNFPVQADLPHFWILASIPIFLFLVGGVLPFFMGIHRYRAQVKTMFDWLEQWLKQVLITNTLPFGDLRSRQLQDELSDLGEEITRRISENQLLQFYRGMTEGQNTDLNALPAASEATPETGQAAAPAEANASPRPNFAEQARSALTFVQGRASRAGGPEPTADVATEVVRNNRKNLVYWDFRFYYLKRLLELAEAVPQAEVRDMKPFLDATLQEIEQRPASATVRSNILAGSFLTVMSSLAVWVFKTFQNDILAYVRTLVK